MLIISDNGEAYHLENAEKMRSFKAENCLKRGFYQQKTVFVTVKNCGLTSK